VADQRAVADGEEGGRFSGVGSEGLVSDNVDPSMDPVKEAIPTASVNGRLAQSRLDQLRSRDGPALSSGDPRDGAGGAVCADAFVPRGSLRVWRGPLPSPGDASVLRGIWGAPGGTFPSVWRWIEGLARAHYL
jgi:hypothetical protein